MTNVQKLIDMVREEIKDACDFCSDADNKYISLDNRYKSLMCRNDVPSDEESEEIRKIYVERAVALAQVRSMQKYWESLNGELGALIVRQKFAA